jgi:hypothetical protein
MNIIEELQKRNEKLKEENKNLSELLELLKEIVIESAKRPNRFNDIFKDKFNIDDDEKDENSMVNC